MRPCEEHKPCCYEEFDYGENMTVCGVDFDGDNCPWIKPWGRKKYNERHHKKDGDGEMTGQQLIDWIKQHHAENAVVEVAYRDDGGMHYGTDKKIDPIIIGKNVDLPFVGMEDYERLIL